MVLALVDDFSPTAVEERGNSMRVFFSRPDERNAAFAALAEAHYLVTSVDVDDEDWARRAQQDLGPVTVGRITVAPPSSLVVGRRPLVVGRQSSITIVIEPSMGFGTGHHATTRLCLEALQAFDVAGRTALDIGTGSGVLSIAADRLGAASALGIDNDPDAIDAATRNLALNPDARHVEFRVADLTCTDLPTADVVTANLTAALLIRAAPSLVAAVRPEGWLLLSGLLAEERGEICRKFAAAQLVWEREEDGWIGLAMKKL